MARPEPARMQRRAYRAKIFQPGQMHGAGGIERVHLLDLSLTGALVYAPQPPAVGSIVRLACPQWLGASRVIWVDAKRFGVAFSLPLSEAIFQSVLEEQERIQRRLADRAPLR